MNTTHLHLLLNHFPIIGTLIGSGLLFWGLIKKQANIKVIAAVVLTIMAVIAIPVYLTGEPAEESVEKLPGVAKDIIELHEEAATLAIWLMGITGVASLMALLAGWKKIKATGALFVIVFFLSVVCFAAMARTGYYGGQIRHTEIRNANATLPQNEKGDEKEKAGTEKEVEKD